MGYLTIIIASILLRHAVGEATYSSLNIEFLKELDWQRSLFTDFTVNPLALSVQVNYNRAYLLRRKLPGSYISQDRYQTGSPANSRGTGMTTSPYFVSFNIYLDPTCEDLVYSSATQIDTCFHTGTSSDGNRPQYAINELVEVVDPATTMSDKIVLSQSIFTDQCGGVPQSAVMATFSTACSEIQPEVWARTLLSPTLPNPHVEGVYFKFFDAHPNSNTNVAAAVEQIWIQSNTCIPSTWLTFTDDSVTSELLSCRQQGYSFWNATVDISFYDSSDCSTAPFLQLLNRPASRGPHPPRANTHNNNENINDNNTGERWVYDTEDYDYDDDIISLDAALRQRHSSANAQSNEDAGDDGYYFVDNKYLRMYCS